MTNERDLWHYLQIYFNKNSISASNHRDLLTSYVMHCIDGINEVKYALPEKGPSMLNVKVMGGKVMEGISGIFKVKVSSSKL
ncbi:MAG: hypothetical protein WBL44_01045 [Nitrososphaeraceae archaeon]|jgi:hypothetical protein